MNKLVVCLLGSLLACLPVGCSRLSPTVTPQAPAATAPAAERPAQTEATPALQTYTSQEYRVTLRYPSGWEPIEGYEEKYGGAGGYFQISACCGEISIAEAADLHAHHKLQPYGSEPSIEELTVAGQEARLVLPSSDQPENMAGQAALIVRYPRPVTIRGEEYHYFILCADQGHIRGLAGSVAFP